MDEVGVESSVKPLVLTCNLSPGTRAPLRALCLRLGIRVQPVPPEDFDLPLAALVEGRRSAKRRPAAERFTDEMLVMAFLAPDTLDALLEGLRAARLPRAPLKAVLTETNARWSAAELHRALAAEHAQLRR